MRRSAGNAILKKLLWEPGYCFVVGWTTHYKIQPSKKISYFIIFFYFLHDFRILFYYHLYALFLYLNIECVLLFLPLSCSITYYVSINPKYYMLLHFTSLDTRITK